MKLFRSYDCRGMFSSAWGRIINLFINFLKLLHSYYYITVNTRVVFFLKRCTWKFIFSDFRLFFQHYFLSFIIFPFFYIFVFFNVLAYPGRAGIVLGDNPFAAAADGRRYYERGNTSRASVRPGSLPSYDPRRQHEDRVYSKGELTKKCLLLKKCLWMKNKKCLLVKKCFL